MKPRRQNFRIRLRACISDNGVHHSLHLETLYRDTDLWWVIDPHGLEFLAGGLVQSEAHVKQLALLHEDAIREAIARRLDERGPSSPGGGPRVLSMEDFRARKKTAA
jgi:hypothetical protein